MTKRRKAKTTNESGLLPHRAMPPREAPAVTKRSSFPPGYTDEAAEGRSSGVRQSTVKIPVEDLSGNAPAQLALPSPDRVLVAVLQLARAVTVEMHEDEIVDEYVEALRGLFPVRRFAVRVLSPDKESLILVHATGKLLPYRRDVVEISAETLKRHDMAADSVSGGAVRVVDTHQPLFHEDGEGFEVPLLDGQHLIGVLEVEYPPGMAEPKGERPIIIQMTLQLAAALKNARLLEESRYLRDYLSKLLDHANAPIIVSGPKRDIRVVNRAFLTLTGRSREEFLGQDLLRIMPEGDRAEMTRVFMDALRGDPTIDHEISIPRSGSGCARLAINTASMVGSDGEVEAVIAIGRDVTVVRELEEQVIQAEKLATLGQLAAGVVHELNNPLTSISVYSDFLLQKHDGSAMDPADVEKLRRIVHSADRILRFTRDLVTYARPTAEEPALMAMSDIVEQSLVFCDHLIAESGTRIEKSYAAHLPLVYAVKGQLHQVFINLITNACHAMPQGAGRLTVSVNLGKDEVLIRVADNGVGIPANQLPRLFEPFFSTKGEGQGTGLGLSIVKNIVQQHRGRIKVRSELGSGTTFEIYLPCEPASAR